MSAISLLAIGCHTIRLASRLHTAHIGLGIHVLVADLDGDKITALRPQVERTLAYVQQLMDLFRASLLPLHAAWLLSVLPAAP